MLKIERKLCAVQSGSGRYRLMKYNTVTPTGSEAISRDDCDIRVYDTALDAVWLWRCLTFIVSAPCFFQAYRVGQCEG